MRICELARHVDFASVVKRNDLSNQALNVLRNAIDRGDLEDFLRQDGNLDEYSRDGMIGLLRLRIENLTKRGREFHGFSEAITVVECLGKDDHVSWAAIQTLTHLLVMLIKVSNYDVIGCMSLTRSDKKRPHVPINWDGSPLAET